MPVDVTGGAPLLLDLPITLCSRSDANSSRYFDGELLWARRVVSACFSVLSI